MSPCQENPLVVYLRFTLEYRGLDSLRVPAMGKLFEDTAHVSIKKSFAGQVQDFLHNVFDNKYSSSRQQQKGKKETPNPKKTSFDLKTCGSRQHLLYILLGFGGSCSVFFPAPRS